MPYDIVYMSILSWIQEEYRVTWLSSDKVILLISSLLKLFWIFLQQIKASIYLVFRFYFFPGGSGKNIHVFFTGTKRHEKKITFYLK